MIRKILFLIASIFLTSCTGVFVWTLRDVIGLCFVGVIIVVFIVAKILDAIDNYKRNKKRNP